MYKKMCLMVVFAATHVFGNSDTVWKNIRRANRRVDSKIIRDVATGEEAQQALAAQPTNGDAERYADKRGSYGKGLKQTQPTFIDASTFDQTGFVDLTAYNQLVLATLTGNPADFNAITMGTSPVQQRLHSPQAGLDFNIFGPDSFIHSMIAPPALASAEKAGEMVELYWMALLRDVSFTDYDTDATASMAIADLNNLSDFKGPKVNGAVTAQTLFREDLPGTLIGPYVSQLFFKSVPFSDTLFTQKYTVPQAIPANDFMTTFTEWFPIQEGYNPLRSIAFDSTGRYMRNGRDLGNYVHKDPPQLPYLYAMLILLSFGEEALDQNNPYIGNPTQVQFAEFFKPQFAGLLTYAADVAIRAAWYQKWIVNRTIRPEYYAFLVNQQITGQFDSGLYSDVINSQAVSSIFAYNETLNGVGDGTYLLPIAFPEGCPLHPTYPAGHATVAGACATMLKAFFNEDYIFPSPVVPDAAGTALVPIADSLTLGGEINKLGANIAVGRNMAGVHYRSDATQSMRLGENVAIAILGEWAYTMNIPFKGFSLTKFDGTKILVGAKKTVNLLK